VETGVGSIGFSVANLSGDDQTFSFTFSDTGNADAENALANGAYTLTVAASGITYADSTTLSSNQVFGFYRFYGDFTGQGALNATDEAIFAARFGHPTTGQFWYIDSDENGYINGTDLVNFGADYGGGAPGSNYGNLLSGASATVSYGPDGIVLGVVSLSAVTEQLFFYTDQWQQIQTMKEASPGATPTLAAQNVWGITYVNDLVLRDDNAVTGNLGASPGTGSSTGLGERIYALHDANHDVTSITDASGNVLERFSYDPYGNVPRINELRTVEKYKAVRQRV
jgi:YD repeat-containing protein